jgi:hypothetical protein
MYERPIDPMVEANARLTGWTAVVLFVLLAAEGATILSLRRLLPEHFFIGFLLIPPVLLKMGSTGYRFVRYYTGDRRYRSAGPPRIGLRLLAPVVVVSTVVLFGSGVELWLFGDRYGTIWITAHKLSFVVWFGATGIHVLAYLARAPRLAWADMREPLRGAAGRRGLIVASLLLGIVLALATSQWVTPFVPTG